MLEPLLWRFVGVTQAFFRGFFEGFFKVVKDIFISKNCVLQGGQKPIWYPKSQVFHPREEDQKEEGICFCGWLPGASAS